MSDEKFIEYLYKLVEAALSDPDYFYLSKEDTVFLKNELDKRKIPNILGRWL